MKVNADKSINKDEKASVALEEKSFIKEENSSINSKIKDLLAIQGQIKVKVKSK